ncbi:uncharacterized protein [Antedon mediterranea]|uniref:uncharacterized protein n=1 Tax=Antedon mediterranea TaxID=105859 RepID=UPI003AF4B869
MAEAQVGPKQLHFTPGYSEIDELVETRKFVVEKARRKMANLKRQLEESRMKDGNSQNGSFTDMYGGTEPSVNEELKQRLSPLKSRYKQEPRESPAVINHQQASSPNSSWVGNEDNGQHQQGSSNVHSQIFHSRYSPIQPNYGPSQPNFGPVHPGISTPQSGYGALLVPLFSEPTQLRSPLHNNVSEPAQNKNTAMNSSKDEGCQTSEPKEMKTRIVQVEKSFNIPDLEESMPKLLFELSSSKDLNKELAEKLEEAESEIESMKLMQDLAEAQIAAQIAAKGAAIVDEIYTAQKERDEAVMGRLRLANEERDEALARSRLGEGDGSDSGTDVNSNDEEFFPGNNSVSDLLGKIKHAESGQEVDRYGSSIIDKISNTKDRRKHITSEEMRAIIHERDVAIAKCKKLERQVIENYRATEGTSSKNKELQDLQIQLQSTRQERDMAITKSRKLEEELQNLRMYYSLHKSLSQEANLRDQFNNTLGSIEEQVKARDEVLIKAQTDKNHLTTQLKMSLDERNYVASELQQSAVVQRELKLKCDKLERLVVVLRKKLAEGNITTIN